MKKGLKEVGTQVVIVAACDLIAKKEKIKYNEALRKFSKTEVGIMALEQKIYTWSLVPEALQEMYEYCIAGRDWRSLL